MEESQFVNLLTVNYNRINSYIFCMVHNEADADDIMQETTALMWDKFDQFKTGTNFVAWALTIAKYKILSYQRDKSRNRIQFDDRVVELIEQAAKSKQLSDNTSEKISLLKTCIEKLPEKEHQIISLKFSNSFSNKKLSERVGVSVPTIYRHLARVYANLLNCINQNLNAEKI